jgi:uncharacterized protein (DUF305 family)
MATLLSQRAIAGLLAAVAFAGCSAATGTGTTATPPPPGQAAAEQKSTMFQYPFTEADVHFMSGMIPHHAQAVKIAGWSASHGASPSVRVLSERIVVAQKDEIQLMQTWLMDRRLPVPPADATRHRMVMNGVEHEMLMPGMLNDEELAQLDRARGTEFDRLFLMAMIKHHEGAITMVDQLFAAAGAAQDETVFRFASDVYADQTTEIDRMEKMLAALPGGGRRP